MAEQLVELVDFVFLFQDSLAMNLNILNQFNGNLKGNSDELMEEKRETNG